MAHSRHLKHGVEHPQWSVLGDRLEYNADSEAGELELQAWYGTTYDRLVLKTEAEVSEGKLEQSSTELLMESCDSGLLGWSAWAAGGPGCRWYQPAVASIGCAGLGAVLV